MLHGRVFIFSRSNFQNLTLRTSSVLKGGIDGDARKAIHNTTRRARHVEARRATLECLHSLNEGTLGAHGSVMKDQLLVDHREGQPLIIGDENEANTLILRDEAG